MEEVRPVVYGLVPRVYPLEYPPVVPWVVRPEIRPAAFLIMLPKFTMSSFDCASVQAATGFGDRSFPTLRASSGRGYRGVLVRQKQSGAGREDSARAHQDVRNLGRWPLAR